MKKLVKKLEKFLLVTTLLFALFNVSGCSVWYNFTTYFNLYYNTSDLYMQTEESILAEKKDPFAFIEPNVAGNDIQQLNKVIEKCSKILQFNTESSFVDDALFIIGKCFYFQKNYPKALRKFEELLSQFPESNLALETKLWVARTNLQMRDYTLMLNQLESVKKTAEEEGEDGFIIAAYIEQIKYYIHIEDYDNAIAYGEELVKFSNDGEVNAFTLYQLGETYYLLQEYENAASAYLAVLDYSPSYDTELFAKVKYGKMLRILGELDEAMNIFKELRSEDKNSLSFNLIDLEIGITYRALGNYKRAIEELAIVDTAYGSTVQAGVARYEIGEIYEKHLLNFDSAFVYYQKAYTSSATPEYLPKIREKQPLFNKYKTLNTSLNTYNKQLFYVLNPEEFEKDSINYYAEKKTEEEINETNVQPEGVAARGRERDFSTSPTPGRTAPTPSSSPQAIAPPPVRPVMEGDTLRTLIGKTKFELANLFFTEMEQLDSSYFYYNDLAENYSESPLFPQVLFALGNYYLAIDNKEKADSIFNFIYENFQDDKIINATAAIINKPLIEFDKEPAKFVYLEAENLLNEKSFNASVKKFYDIYIDFPESKYAPKSLHAAGFVLEEKLQLYDSAASVYDTLLIHYPKSEHASKIAPKINFYKQEKQRIEAMIQDSIRKVEEELRLKLQEDSLKKASMLDSLKRKDHEDSLLINGNVDSLNNVQSFEEKKEVEEPVFEEANPEKEKEEEAEGKDVSKVFLQNKSRIDSRQYYLQSRNFYSRFS